MKTIRPEFQQEAEALTQIIAMRLAPARYNLNSKPPADIVRAIAEGLQSAYDIGRMNAVTDSVQSAYEANQR